MEKVSTEKIKRTDCKAGKEIKEIAGYEKTITAYRTDAVTVVNTYLRDESIALGLEPPEQHALTCSHYKAVSPTLAELELQASQHPSKKVRDLQTRFFNAMIDLVSVYEQEALSIFKMPDIETVREAYITGDTEYPGTFSISAQQAQRYRKMLSEWQYDLIADEDLLKQDTKEDEQSAVYNWYMLQLFAVGLVRNKKRGLINVPEDLRPFVENINIMPDTNNEYLKAIKRDGLKRIKIKLSKDQRDYVLSQLRIMAREGHNPLYVAKWMHQEFEGKAWYWNRLARSESTLALNASYDAWADQAQVQYDVWSTGGSRPCSVCSALDGNMWKRGEGPLPVADTHPNCNCERVAQWIAQGQHVNSQWRRPSPYDNPYQIIRDDNGNLIVPELEDLLG